MRPRPICLSLTLLLATVLPASAQQKYTIQLPNPAKNENVHVEKSDDVTITGTILDGMGQAIMDIPEDKKKAASTYLQTVINDPKGDRKTARLKRQYFKAEATDKDGLFTPSFVGQRVVIDYKDGKPRYQIDGGAELGGKDKDFLDKEFESKTPGGVDLDKMMLPGGPVAVGDTWKIDTGPLVEDLKRASLLVDPDKAKVTVKFVKAYKQDGKQFGVLRLEFEFPLKGIKAEDMTINAVPGANLTITADIDGCIDGSSSARITTMRFAMAGEFTIPNQEVRIRMNVTGATNEHRKMAGKS